MASADSNYQQFVWQRGSAFGLEDNGFWFMSDKKDLVFIKTKHTGSNMVEYHVASRASEYRDFTVHEATDFGLETNGTWTIGPKSTGKYPDLYYIKTQNTGSNMVEVHVSSASSNWKQRTLDTGTGFGLEANGQWMVANWTHQPFADLVYLKTQNTGTGKTEVHINEYQPIAPAPYTQSARNISLEGHILTAELKRNDDSWRAAQVDLDMFLGNINGKFSWGMKAFSATARSVRIDGSVLKAELKSSSGSWNNAEYELSQKLLNNDGAFHAIDVPVIIAIPKEQEAAFMEQLETAMNDPNFKLSAREEPDGATTFYANASVEAEGGVYFRTYTADSRVSIMHLSQKKGHPIGQVNIDTFVASANATTSSIAGMAVYAGADAGVSLFKGSASIFNLNLGVGVETGAGIKDGSLDLHIAGCGIQIGRVVSISVFGASFGIDFGRLFG